MNRVDPIQVQKEIYGGHHDREGKPIHWQDAQPFMLYRDLGQVSCTGCREKLPWHTSLRRGRKNVDAHTCMGPAPANEDAKLTGTQVLERFRNQFGSHATARTEGDFVRALEVQDEQT